MGEGGTNGKPVGEVVRSVGGKVEVAGHLHGLHDSLLIFRFLVSLFGRRRRSMRVAMTALDATHNLTWYVRRRV